jgi:predicted unusual protein kinase regulating ubiquinone biosynthesis (AarF/ABC1/UbiB family)
MEMINYIRKIIKIMNITLSTSYHIITYKLNINTYNDTVINVCNLLVSHSYIFIKVIQWGIQNVYDLNFNDELKEYFNTFSNNVPYSNFEQEIAILCINNSIEYASTTDNDKLLIENNYIPINSGSVALVYKARLNDKPVIIKVLRHNIKKNIEKDIDFLEFFFDNTFVKMIINRYTKVNFKRFIENNRDLLLNQCDFECEVNNALIFKNNLKNKKNIVIPHVYKHFTNACNEIIIMDYLDGPVAKNVSKCELGNHFKVLQSFYLESLFLYNILHGDFHLGNIIIINENTVGLIDFGIVYTVTNEISNALFDILIINLNKKKIKHLLHGIKILIKIICVNEKEHEEIFIKLKNDDELINLFLKLKFSGTVLVTILNKIISMDGVELNVYMCNLFLSAMSSLQTIENGMSLIDDDNKSLSTLFKSYIKDIKV